MKTRSILIGALEELPPDAACGDGTAGERLAEERARHAELTRLAARWPFLWLDTGDLLDGLTDAR